MRSATRLTPRAAFSPGRRNAVEFDVALVCVVSMRQLGLMLSVGLWACGDNLPDVPDEPGKPTSFKTAPHAPMPRVLPHAGWVLARFGLVTLTFDGYAPRAEVEAFGDAVVGSTWLATVGLEYGVSEGVPAGTGTLGPAPASLSRAEIASRVRALVTRGPGPTPGAPPLIYLVYVPPGVARGPDLTRDYHEMLSTAGGRAVIAVVLDDGAGITSTTLAAARELVNAAANPYAPPLDGYYADPPMTDPWSLVRGEVADLCAGEEPVAEGGWAFPRVYSSTAAISGRAPCAPFDGDDEWTNVTAAPSQLRTAARGSVLSFTLTGWSTRPVPDWEIRTEAAERSDLTSLQMHPTLSSGTINNSTNVTLKLQVPRTAPSGAFGGVVVASGPSAHPWVVGFIVE